MTENASVSTNSSNRAAKLSARLVNDPVKLSWKKAASLASNSFMATTYRFSIPRPSVRFKQCTPIRSRTSAKSIRAAKPNT